MKYIRFTKGLADKGILINPDDLYNYVESEKDCYSSIYYYNEEQKRQFERLGTISGINDVYTDKIVFDFDQDDLNSARKDAVKVLTRLETYNIKPETVEIYFSGNKGFSLICNIDRILTPKELRHVALKKVGKDIPTVDPKVYNASRIFRIPGTKHQESGNYKIPLTLEELQFLSIEDIVTKSKSLDNIKEEYNWKISSPSKDLFDFSELKKKETKVTSKIDLSSKPSQWKNCKWNILQGNFKPGDRHEALMVLAATCRGLGYDQETSYHICLSATKKQAELFKQEQFSEEELLENIIEKSVFAENWEGGQYSCKIEGWLQNYCQSLGELGCKHDETSSCIGPGVLQNNFKEFARDADKNLIKTGISSLDENWPLFSFTLSGILGAPGSGKTTLGINILRNANKENIPSVFCSLDMGAPIVYGQLIKSLTGISFKDSLKIFKDDPERANELYRLVEEEYKNVGFNFKSGLTVQEIGNIIRDREEEIGKKVRLVVVDYLECLGGPYSDQTANTGFVANQLKDLANQMKVCILILLQTQKHSTNDISDPLLTMRAVKGSSLIEQACRTILTMWREGYNPQTMDYDKFISLAVVKNTFGSLWSRDYFWNGAKGEIRELLEEEQEELYNLRNEKIRRRKEESEKTGWI